jgi:diguanylate cyclase (GGDEF)-like protein
VKGDAVPSPRLRLPEDGAAALLVGIPVSAVALAATVFIARHAPAHVVGLPALPWLALAAMFAIAQDSIINVQVLREARSISLTDAPFVFGLFLVSPGAFIAARVTGAVFTQVVFRRQYREPVKLAFNTVTAYLEASLGTLLFLLLCRGTAPTAGISWAAAVLAAVAANVSSGLAVGVLIGRLERSTSLRALGGVAVSCALHGLTMGSLGLVAVFALYVDPWTAVPLLVAGGVLVAGYRGYARLADRHDSMERLYQFGRVVSSHTDPDLILEGLLEQVCELLFADAAALTLFSSGQQPDSEAWLRRGGQLDRVEGASLVSQAGWLVDRITRERQPVRLPRGTRDLAARHWLSATGLNEAMIVPLIGDGGVLAALAVGDRLGAARGFDRTDLRLLETVANHAAIALRNGQLMERLRHDSLHDALTGVANRAAFHREVDRLLSGLANGGSPFAVAMLDLDSFKDVNDTLGHQKGDLLLCEVARRLTEVVGRRGLVTRFGGDEFAILLPDCTSDESAVRVGRGILDALSLPVDMDGTMVDIGGSVGIARAPAHAESREELVKRADVAMYVAKQAGREVVVYHDAYDTTSPNRLAMTAALRAAVTEGRVEVYVQPQIELGTSAVVAAEALVRWHDPQLGWVSPDEFIPLAERSGLIRPLTDFVLERSIAACADWQVACPDIAVSVNLSARSLHDDGLDEQVGRLLERYRLPAKLLTLEITESSVMADPSHTLGLLHRLRLRGVRLSIDDFGTGYSSLSYLRRLPVQEVKVDRSFVQRMHIEDDDAAIVRAIVELARTLDLTVVAEGVENGAVLEVLGLMRCDVAQGYYIARPMPALEFPSWYAGQVPYQRAVRSAADLRV